MFHVKHSSDISSFALKLVAIISMTCNHFANVFAGILPGGLDVALYSIGGATFPIMSFMLSEGYAHTSNVKKYAGRLLAFALISQVPYSLLWGTTPNVLFTLLVGLGVLHANAKIQSQATFIVIFLAACVGTIPFDWGCVGIVMIHLFGTLRGRKKKMRVIAAICVAFVVTFIPAAVELADTFSHRITSEEAFALFANLPSPETGHAFCPTAPQNTIYQAGQFVANLGIIGYSTIGFGLAAALLCKHRGRRGHALKWLFYSYYPAHLVIIWALAQAIAI